MKIYNATILEKEIRKEEVCDMAFFKTTLTGPLCLHNQTFNSRALLCTSLNYFQTVLVWFSNHNTRRAQLPPYPCSPQFTHPNLPFTESQRTRNIIWTILGNKLYIVQCTAETNVDDNMMYTHYAYMCVLFLHECDGNVQKRGTINWFVQSRITPSWYKKDNIFHKLICSISLQGWSTRPTNYKR